LFEKLNGYRTSATNQECTLATRIILPRESSRLADSYGYEEFLSHQSIPDNDVGEVILEELNNKAHSNVECTQAIRKAEEAELKALAQQVVAYREQHGDDVSAWPFDFVLPYINTEQHYSSFSYGWGASLAVARVFGLSDIHAENVLISKLALHFVDTEVIFSSSVKFIEATSAIDQRVGAMSCLAKVPTSVPYITTIAGVHHRTDVHLSQKQRLFHFLYRLDEENDLQVCPVRCDDFQRGYRDILQCICDHRRELCDWLKAPIFNHVFVRVLLQSTNTLRQEMNCCLMTKQLTTMLAEQRQRTSEMLPILLKGLVDNSFLPKDVWTELRFMFDHIFHNYANRSIPSWYIHMTQRELFTGQGDMMTMAKLQQMFPGNFSQFSNEQKQQLSNMGYVNETPQNFFVQRLRQLKQEFNQYLTELDNLEESLFGNIDDNLESLPNLSHQTNIVQRGSR